MAVSELAFKILETTCTTEQIQSLLREFRPLSKDNIRISAENKETIVHRNLRHAVDSGVIPDHRVYSLVRDSEESGSQHIFYFRVNDKSLRKEIGNVKQAARILMGKDWSKDDAPYLTIDPPNAPIWSEFHSALPALNGSTRRGGTKGSSWTARQYASDLVHEKIGERQNYADGSWADRYRTVQRKTVHVVRYHHWGVIELRVPRWESRKGVYAMRDRLKAAISHLVPWDQVPPWDLTPALTTMLKRKKANSGVYELGGTTFDDGELGAIKLIPRSSEDALYENSTRADTVSMLLEKKRRECHELHVKWLATAATDHLQSDLRTFIGGEFVNELVVGARTNSKSLDYVAHRLREYGKRSA